MDFYQQLYICENMGFGLLVTPSLLKEDNLAPQWKEDNLAPWTIGTTVENKHLQREQSEDDGYWLWCVWPHTGAEAP